MGQILSNGEVTYITRTDMVIRSSGGGGVVGRIIVIPEKIVYSDTPPEPKCIEIEQGFDINCITLVAEEATEKCITISVENPSLDIEPEITPDEGCSEYTDKPTFEILTVNGEVPVLMENLDEDGIVYIKQDDVVVINITNYKEGVEYDTPYTNHDNIFQEYNGSNYIWDNGEGILIFVYTEFYSILDGSDIEIWVYAQEGEKCRNVSDKWMGMRTMVQSTAPILQSYPTDEGTSNYVDILNYNSNNKYVELHSCEKLSNLVVAGNGIITFDSAYLTDTNDNIAYLYVSAIEPLKYKSQEVFVTIEILFDLDWKPIYTVSGDNEFDGCGVMICTILNYRENRVLDSVTLTSISVSHTILNTVEFTNVNKGIFKAPTLTNNSSDFVHTLVATVIYSDAIDPHPSQFLDLIPCDAFCLPYGSSGYGDTACTMVLRIVYYQPSYVYWVGKSVVRSDPFNCRKNSPKSATLSQIDMNTTSGYPHAVIKWNTIEYFYGTSSEYIGTYLYAQNINGIVNRSWFHDTHAIVGSTICYQGGQ